MTKTEEATRIVRSARDGRLTIPVEFRRALGIGEATELVLTLKDGELRLRPVGTDQTPKGSPWLRELYDYFAPVRQEAEEKGYTDEQINEWIDEALAAYRREQGG